MTITYRFSEELDMAVFYAKKLGDERALSILNSGSVASADDAKCLSRFFWRLVDACVEDKNNDVDLPWEMGVEFLNEKLMNSLSGYLERNGYEREWDEVSDEQGS